MNQYAEGQEESLPESPAFANPEDPVSEVQPEQDFPRPPLITKGSDHVAIAPPASPNQYSLPLTAKVSEEGELEIGGCNVSELTEKYGTPLFILDEATLRQSCAQYRDALNTYYQGESLALYASKAWNCWAINQIVRSEGMGIDVMSGAELHSAIKAGFKGELIYFHGNNKS